MISKKGDFLFEISIRINDNNNDNNDNNIYKRIKYID